MNSYTKNSREVVMALLKRLVLAGMLLFSVTIAQSAEDFTGTWQGAIEVPGSPLDVEVALQLVEGDWSGTIDIPAQGAMGLPLENIFVQGEEISFAIGGIPGEPAFEGALSEGRIEGTFTQAGQEFPFALERFHVADPLTVGPTQEQEDVYEDPEGRFTVPIPANWTAEQREGYGILASPDGEISVYLLTIPGDDVEAAIAAAWQQVSPGFALEPAQVQEPPAIGGLERVLVVTYETADDEIVQGVGQLHEGVVYVLLFEAELIAAQQRASQINIVNTGFAITALEREDLAGREPIALSAEVLAELEAYIEDALVRFGVPGAAVAVVQDGEMVYAGGFGRRGPETAEPITPETLMMIGSTTKTMTTMLMAILVDEGLMAWDTLVVDILPDFAVADPELTEQITIEHLVCACTGVPARDYEFIFNFDVITAEDIISMLRDFELFTDFGEAFQYSNEMVAAGGYAAAAASGADYGNLYEGYLGVMQEQVLDPMGLASSTFSFDEVAASGNYATPHSFTLDFDYAPISLHIEGFVTPVAPAGALWSNASDMGRYLITAMNEGMAPEGRRVVSAGNLRHTWEPQVPITADMSYGLGWMVSDYNGLTLLHHGGNTFGFTSDLAFLPEAGIGISVITNGRLTNPFNEAVRFRLFELAFDLEAEHDEQAMFALENLTGMLGSMMGELAEQVDAEVIRPYEGRYTSETLGEITLALEDGRLIVDAGAFSVQLLPRVEDAATFSAIAEPLFAHSFRLAEDDVGNPIVVFGEGVREYTFVRVE